MTEKKGFWKYLLNLLTKADDITLLRLLFIILSTFGISAITLILIENNKESIFYVSITILAHSAIFITEGLVIFNQLDHDELNLTGISFFGIMIYLISVFLIIITSAISSFVSGLQDSEPIIFYIKTHYLYFLIPVSLTVLGITLSGIKKKQ